MNFIFCKLEIENDILNNFFHWNFWSKCIPTRQEIEKILGKCPNLRKNVSFFITNLFFNFDFFVDPNYFHELFGSPIELFFRFFALFWRKFYFGMRSWKEFQKSQFLIQKYNFLQNKEKSKKNGSIGEPKISWK